MYHNNIRGALSKSTSLEAITKTVFNNVVNDPEADKHVIPNIITLNEINLRKNKKLNIEGYECFNKNRINGHMGGVATLVAEKDYSEALKMIEGLEGYEYIVTKHCQIKVPINIINIYGDIESRTPVDVIDNKWEEILKEISKIEARE